MQRPVVFAGVAHAHEPLPHSARWPLRGGSVIMLCSMILCTSGAWHCPTQHLTPVSETGSLATIHDNTLASAMCARGAFCIDDGILQNHSLL